MRATGAIAALAAALALSATARAEPRPYRGPHPTDLDGHWHEEDAVHVHDDLVVGDEAFAEVDGVLVFLGDPDAYGWDGAVWTYDGIHPLPARIGEYCGIPGPHRHPFPPEGDYRQVDGRWRFTGALRGGVPAHRPGVLEPSPDRLARYRTGEPEPELPVAPWVPFCGFFQETVGATTTTFAAPCFPPPAVVVVTPGHGDREHRRRRPPPRGEERPAPAPEAEPRSGPPRRLSPRHPAGWSAR